MKILIIASDLSGVWTYRSAIPLNSLKKYGVLYTWYAFLPNFPGEPSEDKYYLDLISRYDLVILQRCYLYQVALKIRKYCDFLGKPLVFETDDDYLHLPPSNPAYYGDFIPLHLQGQPLTREQLEYERLSALEGYKELLSFMDLITVSTPELKDTIYPYNKNVEVLPNTVDDVRLYNYYDCEQPDPRDPTKLAPILNRHGMVSIPSYYIESTTNELKHVVRIGYSGTASHKEDFKTVEWHWEKLINKYIGENRTKIIDGKITRTRTPLWFVYLGDPYFHEMHQTINKRRGLENRAHWIPPAPYDYYFMHMRNLDISMAPLTPDVFNMSKSPIKAIEAAVWGTPSVLPNYVTYTRDFKAKPGEPERALFYNNGQEFYEIMEELINNPDLRFKIGNAARDWISENRLSHQHAEHRYNLYKGLVDNTAPLTIHKPVKELVANA